MSSKTRDQEDTTPECEDPAFPPKERINRLLLEVKNRNLAGLMVLVNEGVDVKSTGEFSMSEQLTFANVPALFAATISDQPHLIIYLCSKFPHFSVEDENSNTQQDSLILPTGIDVEEKRIEVRELVGAACLFSMNIGARKHGSMYCDEAMKLREANDIPKIPQPQSDLERLALNNSREFLNTSESAKLLKKSQTFKATQAFLIFQRIQQKYNLFPSKFAVSELFKFALLNWKTRPLSHSLAFCRSLYLFELFGTGQFLEQLVLDPTASQDVVRLTFIEFSEILQDRRMWQRELGTLDTVFTFEHFLFALKFAFQYRVNVHDHSPSRKTRRNKKKTIGGVILTLLEILISIPKTESDSERLKSCLTEYINLYELARGKSEPNLLLKVCATFEGETNQFELIKLLLEAGSKFNAVDEDGNRPLDILSFKELLKCSVWDLPTYSIRGNYFTEIVRMILNGMSADQHGEMYGGIVWLRRVRYYHLNRYPNSEFHELLSDMLEPQT